MNMAIYQPEIFYIVGKLWANASTGEGVEGQSREDQTWWASLKHLL